MLSHSAVQCQYVKPTSKQEQQFSACCTCSLQACKHHKPQGHSNGCCSVQILPKQTPRLRPTHLPPLQAYEQRERQRAADRRRGAEILDEQLAERERERIKQEELRQLVGPLYRVATPTRIAAARESLYSYSIGPPSAQSSRSNCISLSNSTSLWEAVCSTSPAAAAGEVLRPAVVLATVAALADPCWGCCML